MGGLALTINVVINGEAGNSVRSKLNQVITVINNGLGANTILNGEGAPNNVLGNDGDFYLNTANLNFYGPKVSGVWGSFVALGGADGEDGNTILNGTEVPDSGLGVDGDFYLRTSTLDFYGPKTMGAWGSPVSIKGETGSVTSASGLTLEPIATPSAPSTGSIVYTKADNLLYYLPAAGSETQIGGGEGANIPLEIIKRPAYTLPTTPPAPPTYGLADDGISLAFAVTETEGTSYLWIYLGIDSAGGGLTNGWGRIDVLMPLAFDY